MIIVTTQKIVINADYIAYIWHEEATGCVWAELSDKSEIRLGKYKDAETAELAVKRIAQCWGGISSFNMPEENQ